MKLIECVPNFSNGQDPEIIEAITKSISCVENIRILSVEPGFDANRTVITFIGPPENIKIAAFNSIKTASELIDMQKQIGEHPRIGAVDVFPFIPLFDTSMEEAITIADEVAQKAGKELGIPVYLYEDSARIPERKNLSTIRKGEYQGLEQKMKDKNWKPDFGTDKFNAKSGATVIGARNILIAYNINLSTEDKEIASLIASEIRESGKYIIDNNGEKKHLPGIFKSVKAIGWYIKEYKKAQVSINITNYQIASIHEIFEVCKSIAIKHGTSVTGSELIGLIPKSVLMNAGEYYLRKNNCSINLPEKDLILYAIEYLGLNEIGQFDVKKKILEYAISS